MEKALKAVVRYLVYGVILGLAGYLGYGAYGVWWGGFLLVGVPAGVLAVIVAAAFLFDWAFSND